MSFFNGLLRGRERGAGGGERERERECVSMDVCDNVLVYGYVDT